LRQIDQYSNILLVYLVYWVYNMQGETSTIVGYGQDKKYLRSSIPSGIVEAHNLQAGDVLFWSVCNDNHIKIEKLVRSK
jgi:hypothetical protein